VTQQIFSRYRIIGELGSGAMGTVYRALDPLIEREVAIKTLHGNLPEEAREEIRERFLREARSAGRLNHPNIVTIYDVGEENGVAYIAMELLEGRSLQQILRGTPQLPLYTVAGIAAQIAEALDHAQRFKIVHRDVKPANVMVSPAGLVKLTDFGVAYVPSSAITQTGTALGSPRYMSPEQVIGLAIDPRSDIFSLGVLLYEMLARQTPFDRPGETNIFALMQRITREPHRPVREFNAQIPEEIDRILSRALAKKPEERYQRAGDMANDLRNLIALKERGKAGSPIDPTLVVQSSAAARPTPPPAATPKTPAHPPAASLNVSSLVNDLDEFAKNFERERQARLQAEEAERQRKEDAVLRWGAQQEQQREQFVEQREQKTDTLESRRAAAIQLLRKQATHHADDSAARQLAQTTRLDQRLRTAYRYFLDIAAEIKASTPVFAHPYRLAHFGDLTDLFLRHATADTRPRKVLDQEVCDFVAFRYEMAAPRAVTVDLSAHDLAQFRRQLDAASATYTLAERKNEFGQVARAIATLGCVACRATLRGDYEKGIVDIELRNVRRLGVAQTRMTLDGFNDEALDSLVHYLFGFSDAFGKLLRPS